MVGCCWVYAIKRDTDGSIIKHKVRFVAQEYSQISGQDYFATYALVVRLKSYCTCAAIATIFDLDNNTIAPHVASPMHQPLETINMGHAITVDMGSAYG